MSPVERIGDLHPVNHVGAASLLEGRSVVIAPADRSPSSDNAGMPDDGLPVGPAVDADMAAHVILERATFPLSRPSLVLARGRRFVAARAPAFRSSFGSAAMLGLRFVQARLISVWGLVVAAMFCPPPIFAAFAVFSAAATFVSIGALLRLEAVFFRSSDRGHLGRAFRLALCVGAIFLGLAALVLAILAGLGRIAPAVALIFFVSLAARTALRLLWAEATAEGDFRSVGNSNVVQAMIQPVLMLLLIAIFEPKALALFLADALGHAMAGVYLLRRRRASLLALVRPARWSAQGLLAAAWHWRDAPRLLLPSALLSYGFTVAPLLALPYAANALLAAHVALAMRLLDVPTQMFGTVSSPPLLNRLRFYSGPRRQFWVRLAMLGLIAAAIALFASIALGVALVDGLLDGTKWDGVGHIIAIMALFYGGIALVTPLHDIAALTRRPSWQVATNAVALLAVIATMLWFGHLTPALLYAVGLISIARTLAHVLFIWIGLGDDIGADESGLAFSGAAR